MKTLHTKLNQILADRNLRAADVVRLTGLPQPTVSRLLKGGQDNPTLSTLLALSKGLKISVSELLGDDCNVADKEPVAAFRRIPLINWVQAGALTPLAGNEAEEWIYCPVNISENGFALKVRGESMEPKFQEGDIVFVDPEEEPRPGKIVIAQDETFSEAEATMKKLIVEDNQAYLRALNPEWPGPKFIKITPSIRIVGVVVGKYVPV